MLCKNCLNKQMGKNENCAIKDSTKEIQGLRCDDEDCESLYDNKYCPKCKFYFKNKNMNLEEKQNLSDEKRLYKMINFK